MPRFNVHCEYMLINIRGPIVSIRDRSILKRVVYIALILAAYSCRKRGPISKRAIDYNYANDASIGRRVQIKR